MSADYVSVGAAHIVLTRAIEYAAGQEKPTHGPWVVDTVWAAEKLAHERRAVLQRREDKRDMKDDHPKPRREFQIWTDDVVDYRPRRGGPSENY